MAPRSSKASARAPPTLPSKTFVLDNGGYSIKAGFAPVKVISDSETLSKCHTIPNAFVRTRDKTYVGIESEEIAQWGEALFRRPVENGQVVSWEAQKEIWDRSFFDDRTARKELLVKSPEETTLILTEPPNSMPALQKNADEIVMEEWGFGGYSRVIGPSLNAYNDLHPLFEGTSTSISTNTDLPMECLLVIDSGYSNTSITPLLNGRPLHRAIRRLDFGGKHLTNLLKEKISVRHFDLHQDTKIVNDIKEDVCYVSEDFEKDLEETWKGNNRKHKPPFKLDVDGDSDMKNQDRDPEIRVDYILPDGVHLLRGYSRAHDPMLAVRKRKQAALPIPGQHDSEISMTLGNERFSIPEILFSPSDIGSKQPGIPDIVMQSLSVLPPLVQATMLSNLLVVGGNAQIPGFVQRIEAELRARVKTEWQVRARKMDDSTTSTWLGGARMALRSPAVVREYGITRDEYLEHGSAWIARRFVNGGSGKGP